ncbi:MAG: hypothetical protein ACHQ1G_01955 [Planctomycetota bacterium]
MRRTSLLTASLVFGLAVLAAPRARAEGDPAVRRAVETYLAEAGPHDAVAPGEWLFAAAEDGQAEPWTFTAGIYLWALGIEGDIAARGTTTSIDVPFSELFDDLSGAFMGRFGARKGKWGVLVDIFWSRVEDSTTGPIGGTISAEVNLFIAELTGSYRVLESGEAPKGVFTLDAYGGARVYSVEVEISTALAAPEQSETWVDPIIGFDARYRTHKWLFLARCDIGGFEISSELCWSVTVGVAFECSKLISLAAGYRWLDIDFESGGTGFTDVQLAGPYFALVFTW